MAINIKNLIQESSETKASLASDKNFLAGAEKAIALLKKVVSSGGTIYSCGNGGSACDSMHFTEELVARYKKDRPGIKAMHFLDQGTLTCWSNDYEYNSLFARYVETFCDKNDAFVFFSTSGKSPNILNALEIAKKKGVRSIGLLGKGGGPAKDLCDIPLVVPSDKTERIQECHILMVHIFCEALEETSLK